MICNLHARPVPAERKEGRVAGPNGSEGLLSFLLLPRPRRKKKGKKRGKKSFHVWCAALPATLCLRQCVLQGKREGKKEGKQRSPPLHLPSVARRLADRLGKKKRGRRGKEKVPGGAPYLPLRRDRLLQRPPLGKGKRRKEKKKKPRGVLSLKRYICRLCIESRKKKKKKREEEKRKSSFPSTR